MVFTHDGNVALALFREANDAFVIFDLTTRRIEEVNPICQRITGLSRQQLLGMLVTDLIAGDTAESERRFEESLDATQFFHSREGYRLAVGDRQQELWVNLTVSRIHTEPKAFGLVVLRDITDRRQTEAALRASEAKYRTLVQHIPGMVYRGAPDWSAEILSNSERICGYAVADFRSGNLLWSDIIHPDDKDRVLKEAAQLEKRQSNLVQEYRIIDKNGAERWVTDYKSSFFSNEGKFLGVDGVIYDNTDRKHAEEQRLKLERQVQQTQKVESLGVLAGGIAKDFNNILMAILGNADLALEDLPKYSPVRPCLQEIQDAGRRAAELTRQMLAYSGKGHFVVGLVDVSEMIDDMANLLRSAVSKKTSLRLRLAPDLPAVRADVAQLPQVVMNLVTNASEALDQATGGVVTVATGRRHCTQEVLACSLLETKVSPGEYVALEVTDTGCGMNDETKAKLFEPFFSTKLFGRGLGLSAVSGIVRGHKGALLVESQPEKGTTFTVLFPASGESVVNEARSEEETQRWRGTGTVLLADDEDAVRNVAKLLLERLGFTVLVAKDGQEAVGLFRQRRREIRCVILDLSMPLMDGVQALREIRKVEPNARVIVSSGDDEKQVRSRFSELGLAAVLQKPFTVAKLSDSLRKTLEMRVE